MFLYVTNLDAFASTPLAAEDSNSGLWRFQKAREVFAQRDVGAVFYRGSLQANLDGAVHDARDFIAAGARLNSNVEDDRTVGGIDDEMLAAAGAMSNRVALGHGSE